VPTDAKFRGCRLWCMSARSFHQSLPTHRSTARTTSHACASIQAGPAQVTRLVRTGRPWLLDLHQNRLRLTILYYPIRPYTFVKGTVSAQKGKPCLQQKHPRLHQEPSPCVGFASVFTLSLVSIDAVFGVPPSVFPDNNDVPPAAA